MHRISQPITQIDTSKFFVVTMISNPCRYRVRYDLYRKFKAQILAAGIPLMTVEVAFGNRPFEVTDPNDPWSLQLRTTSEIWHKENALNLGVAACPMRDWRYVGWVDADISFVRPDWAHETVQQLQHYQIVQMWSVANDLMVNLEPFRTHRSFCASYLDQIEYVFDPAKDKKARPGLNKPEYNYDLSFRPSWHSGYAWACRREAWDHLGGLIDWAVLGSADRHMALALIGEADKATPQNVTDSYRRKVVEWGARAEKHLQRNIGVVPGLINHYWHGKKVNRRYRERWKLLEEHQFDPDYDLKRDSQGLYQLTDRNFRFRDDLRAYFRAREEDSIDFE